MVHVYINIKITFLLSPAWPMDWMNVDENENYLNAKLLHQKWYQIKSATPLICPKCI